MKERLIAARLAGRVWTSRFEARLKRTTVRERMLLGALVLAAASYGPIAAAQWRAAQEDRYVEAVTQLADARRARDSARRLNTSLGNLAAVEDMRTWGFEADNLALAQVLIERRLLKSAVQAGFVQFTVAMDSETEAVGPTRWLATEIQSDLTWRSVFAFLDDLASWPEGFQVESFAYDFGSVPLAQQDPNYGYGADAPRPAGKLRLRLSFPVKLAVEESAP